MTPVLDTARRLEALGAEIRSAELREEAQRQVHFAQHGNRAMRRRAAKRARAKQ